MKLRPSIDKESTRNPCCAMDIKGLYESQWHCPNGLTQLPSPHLKGYTAWRSPVRANLILSESLDSTPYHKTRTAPTAIMNHSTSQTEQPGAPTVIKYIIVEENEGATYTLNPGDRIGTQGLRTCLGVYFAISPTRCFCAHMNIDIQPLINVDENIEIKNAYFVNEATKQSIITFVTADLQQLKDDEAWGDISDLMRRTLVLCSPAHNSEEINLTHNERNLPVSHAAAQAVREFLEIPATQVAEYPVLPYGGFIATHPLTNRVADVTYFEAVRRTSPSEFGYEFIRADGMTQDEHGVWGIP